MFRKVKLTGLFVALALTLQALPAGAMQFNPSPPQQLPEPAADVPGNARAASGPPPPNAAEWDPKNPAAVEYPDGAWGVAYNDGASPPNLLFRRSLGGADPQYWRDALTIEAAAERPSMVRLGGTTALFYGKIPTGTAVREIFLKTSTNDGVTWSSPVQLTSGSPAHVFEIQTLNLDGTVYLFWSRSDTTGVLQYRTSTDLGTWSAPAQAGQPVGKLQGNTYPTFAIEKLSSGQWAMTWLDVSFAGGGVSQPANDPNFPVVWFGRSADLSAGPWTDRVELFANSAFGPRLPKSVALAQDSAGAIQLAYQTERWPSDEYLYLRSSTDGGATFALPELVGYEPSRSTNGSGGVEATNPLAVKTNAGPVRLFWDMQASAVSAGPYPAQLFRRDLPAGPITQISVSKEQMSKCGPCVPTGAFVADPVNATTGNFTLPETDFAIPATGPALVMARTYNSHRLTDGPLGFGWTMNHDERLQTFSRGEVLVTDATGRADLYTPKAGGGYDPPPGRFATLAQNPDTSFTLKETDHTTKAFDTSGRLQSITDRNSNALTLGYSAGKLTSVSDQAGRSLSFAYSGSRISSVTDPLGRTVAYGYDPSGNLTSVTDPRGKVWTMTYDPSHRMLTKKDPNNNTVLTNTYTSLDRVATQKDAKNGVTTFNYRAEGGRTDVADPRGFPPATTSTRATG